MVKKIFIFPLILILTSLMSASMFSPLLAGISPEFNIPGDGNLSPREDMASLYGDMAPVVTAGNKLAMADPVSGEEGFSRLYHAECGEDAGSVLSGSRTYKIFGPRYQNVQIKSATLEGAVYFLKAGHGGPDPGAMGTYQRRTLCEDEYAYDVILRLGHNLIENGATVYFIIRDPDDGIRDEQFLKVDKDEVCHPELKIPLNQVKRLKQRTNAVNRLADRNRGRFQREISIHVDSRSESKNIDVFFYHDKRSKKGEKTAKILKNTFEEKYKKHQPGRGYHGTVSDRDLYVVTHSRPVSVYIELGNIHHQRDQQRIILPENRQALANWLTEGLLRDFKTNK